MTQYGKQPMTYKAVDPSLIILQFVCIILLNNLIVFLPFVQSQFFFSKFLNIPKR